MGLAAPLAPGLLEDAALDRFEGVLHDCTFDGSELSADRNRAVLGRTEVQKTVRS
jgi:hypothetical protein